MSRTRLRPEERAAIESVLTPLRPVVVYLFGSKGTDQEHPASDIDLAILPSSSMDPVECFDLANRISSKLDVDVDLVDLTTASTVMCKEVLRTGERIVMLDPLATGEFEMRTLSSYARLNEERAEILVR